MENFFRRLEERLDSDETWIREFMESGLENCRLCLQGNQECMRKLEEPGLTLLEYDRWLRARPGSKWRPQRPGGRLIVRDLDRAREVTARKLRVIPQAIERLTR